MDTNQFSVLVSLLSQPRSGIDNQSLFLIFGMIITAVGGIASTVASIFANAQAKAATASANATNATAKVTQEEAVKIHTAVNSERSAMMLEVKTLRDEILVLSKDKAVSGAREREQEIKNALATVPTFATVPLTEERLLEILDARDARRKV